jgi:hypothetical protein
MWPVHRVEQDEKDDVAEIEDWGYDSLIVELANLPSPEVAGRENEGTLPPEQRG